MSRTFSGKEIIRILSKNYGFVLIGISGSHVKLRRSVDGLATVTIVPLHKEVFVGTFKSILRQTKILEKDFIEKSRE
jgi:predicted RNA binding protein YcfA (HicA-like mRNA interferase family)